MIATLTGRGIDTMRASLECGLTLHTTIIRTPEIVGRLALKAC